MDMIAGADRLLTVDEDDLAAFKTWLAAKGVDPVIEARIEVTDLSLRSLRHAARPGSCRMETNEAGEAWRVAWSSGLYIQECAQYRLLYRAHDEEVC